MRFRCLYLSILLVFALAMAISSPAEEKIDARVSESSVQEPAKPPGLGNPLIHYLTPDVYAITGLYHPADEKIGVAAGIIFTENSIVFIDAGMTLAAGEYLWQLVEERMRGDENLFLILSHRHSDHVFGMRVMKEKGALVIAHRIVRDFFQNRGDRYKEFVMQMMGWSPKQADQILGDIVLSLPDQIVVRDTVIYFDGEEIRVLVTPGHAEGELSVYHPKSKTLFAGDTIYEGMPPFTKFGGPEEWKLWIEQLKRLKEMKIETIVPGHGKICQKTEIDKNIAYLQEEIGKHK